MYVLLDGDLRRWEVWLSVYSVTQHVCTVQTLRCILLVLQCHPSGCLTDLFIQMAVIMLLKQTLNNIFEFTVPWVCYVFIFPKGSRRWCLFTTVKLNLIRKQVVQTCKRCTNVLFSSWLKSCFSRNAAKKLQRKCGYCYRKACRDEEGHVEPCDICKLRDWLRNYHLADTDAFSLFNEFLEMGGFTHTHTHTHTHTSPD